MDLVFQTKTSKHFQLPYQFAPCPALAAAASRHMSFISLQYLMAFPPPLVIVLATRYEAFKAESLTELRSCICGHHSLSKKKSYFWPTYKQESWDTGVRA